MKHIKQKGHDCLLASVCMVLDLNYEYYSKQVPSDPSWNFYLHKIRNKRATALFSRMYTMHPERGCSTKDWPALRIQAAKLANHLQGRGILLIRCAHRDWSHAMAYEDGMVYDPADHLHVAIGETPATAAAAKKYLQRQRKSIWAIVPI